MLSIDKAAERLGVSPQFIRSRVESGEIKAAKFGRIWRIRREDLENYIRRQYKQRKGE